MSYLEDLHLEALLEAGYIVMLVLLALGLEQLARIAHRSSERFETAGFRYHASLDAWECPVGEHLVHVGMSYDGKVAHYRARASICNRCPVKSECTDSDTGRKLERMINDWPRSDITRFYRGLALVLVVLAVFIGGVGLVRSHNQADVVALGGVLVLATWVGRRMILTGAGPR